MATTGTLMTAKNIYGLVNPPPDPSGNDPLVHQTINSGATNWGSHIDLSNAVVRLTTNQTIAGDKTFTGTVIAPTPVESDNTTKIATTAFVKTCTYNLVDGAPTTLNTLNELAAAINDDNNFHTTMTTALATKHASITSGARLNANLIGDNGNVSNTEYGYLNGVTSAIQTQMNGKQNIIGSFTRLNANLIGDNGNVSNTEYGYLNGVTSAIQTQIDSKQATITDGDLTIARTSGLQTALDLKSDLAGPTFTGVPAAPTATAGTNTTQLATTEFVKTAVDNLVDSAPGALDTLNELAAAIGDDANYAATVTTALSGKHPSITTLARLNANLIHDGSVDNTEFGYLNGVTSAIQTQIDSKQATITDGDLTIARTSGLQAALDSKQATITDASLTIARTSGLQAALDAKQATITDASLTIARTSGLQAALDAKQATITILARLNANLIHDGSVDNTEFGYLNGVTSAIQTQIDSKQATITDASLTIARTSGLQAALDAKQATITDGDLTIARTTGLQAALDSKAPLAAPTFTGTPAAPTATAGTNTTQLATTAFVKTAVDNLVDSAPGALDTLNELAAAIGDDANYAATVTTALSGKHPSITTSSRLDANLIGANGDVSNTEYGYLDGVTSAIQTQIDSKQATITDGDLTIARTTGLQTALDSKQATITSSVDVSMNNLWVQGDISCNGGIEFKGHILPLAHETYDIGAADKKIRHLFLSDNSLWIGDNHKIDITGGKMKFKKRKTDIVPASILAAGGDAVAALAFTAGVGQLQDMQLHHWEAYAHTLAGLETSNIKDIFVSGTSGDWEEDGALDDNIIISKVTGLQSALDAKQPTIGDGDLTIARTSGLQAALDSKQGTITSSTDISMNNLWVEGDISCNSTLKVDTINENTDTSGVTIDSVLLKDNTVTAHTVSASNYAVGNVNFISASRQGNFRDLEVKNSSNNHTILLTGDGGDISIDGTLSADTISEKTSATGVTIDSVLLKDNTVTAHTVSASNYAVGSTNFISASRQGNFRDLEVKNSGNSATILLTGDGGNITIDGTLSADTIGEKTSTSGVTIDGVLLKDNDISANDISSNDLYVDTINERTSASGVTIDGVLLKDNNITCTDLTASGTTAVATQSAGDNTTKIASTAFVKTAIDNLIDGAPGTLDTLKELSTALDNNNSYATTITLQLAQKAPKADPTFTGTPLAPTATTGTNTTQLATTAFVQTAVSGKQDTLTSTGSGIIITATERTDYTDVSNNAVRLTGAQTVAGAKTFSSAVTVGNYTLPTTAGTQGQVLKYPAGGSTLTWGSSGSGGSSIDTTTDVSLNDLGVYGDLSCNAVKLGGHVIPDTNAAYDLGNAEYKIRHLFLSDNSLWVGDNHKIDIVGGKMKFKKRKTNVVPAAITAASGSDSAALAHAGVGSLADMKLHHWEAYAHTLSGLETSNIKDIFVSGTAGDWDEDDDLDNAVKITGDQTIAGTKTFSNAIISASYTTTQRDALTGVAGMVIFNTTVNKHQGYNGSSWNDFY